MMNVLVSGNSGVYLGMEVTIYSLMKHNRNVNLYILTSSFEQMPTPWDGAVKCYVGLSDDEKKKITNIVKYFDPYNSSVTFIDPIDLYRSELEGGANEFSCFTPYAAFRLLADLILTDIDDVLYLDCDTVIQDSIESMYKFCQMSDHYCLASYAEDACEGDGEMVSGVMFFKLNEIRENNFLNLARQNYKRYEYRYPDQMAMRDAGEIGHLPQEYGYLLPLDKYAKQPVIIHFTNGLEKIYSPNISPLRFYRLYPQLKWIQKGLQLIDIIKFE